MGAMMDDPLTLPPVREAGTLVIIRPRRGDGMPEILMTQRAKSLRFAGGAMVFPGGAVDAGDNAFASALNIGLPVADAAARIAAVRETIEECGLALTGGGQVLPTDQAGMLRRALNAGQGLRELALSHGLSFDFEGLIPFTRWCPRPWEARIRYDTRFYITVVDHRDDRLTPDGRETTALFWSSARNMLAAADAGRAHVIFPTRCTLERLAQFSTIDALLDHVRAYEPGLISPWMETRNGTDHICIPDGLGYPHTAWPARGALRG